MFSSIFNITIDNYLELQNQEAAVIETVDPVAPAPVEQEAPPPPVCDPVEQVATPPVVEAAPVEAVNQEDQCPAPPTTEDVPAPASTDNVAAPTETVPEPVAASAPTSAAAAPPPASAYTPPAAGVRGRVPPGGHSSGPFW